MRTERLNAIAPWGSAYVTECPNPCWAGVQTAHLSLSVRHQSQIKARHSLACLQSVRRNSALD